MARRMFTRRQIVGYCIALLLLLGSNAMSLSVQADSLDNKGSEFIFAYMPNYQTTYATNVELHLTGDTAATVNVTYPVNNPTFNTTVQVTPGAVTIVAIPSAAAQSWTANTVMNNAVRASSSTEFVAYLINRAPYTSDAGLALPVDTMNTEYIVLAYNGASYDEFNVVAPYDNTQVTITPKAAITGRAANVPFTLTLNRGQAYLAQATGTGASGDLSGTIITANRPITMMNGNTCTNIPTGVAYCDHIFEVAQPTQSWGTQALVANLPNRPGGTVYRVMASQDGTVVSMDGTVQATINRGQYREFGPITGNHNFTATKPIFVAQYMTGSQHAGASLGDPAMANMVPPAQYLNQYTFSTVGGSQFVQNYLTVIANNNDLSTITLDGTAIGASRFSAIGTSGYSAAVVSLTQGSHTTSSTNGHGITVEGYNADDSYMYPGGALFQFINPVGDANAPVCGTPTIDTTLPQTLTGSATDNRPSEDTNGNRVLDAGEDLNGNGQVDRDTGIFSVSLSNASNLTLTTQSFVPGVGSVNYTVRLTNAIGSGSGTVVVMDGAGNTCRVTVNLVGLPTPTPTATNTPTPTRTPIPTNTPIATNTPTPVPLANLQVSEFVVPVEANSKAATTVNWTVRNSGGLSAPAHDDRVYLSPDATWSSNDTQLNLTQVRDALASNGSYARSATFTMPTLMTGNYYLIVRTDTANTVVESIETDNTRVAALVVRGIQADLVPSALSAPASASTGQSIAVQWSVANQGVASAAAHDDGLYLSTDATWNSGDVRLSLATITTTLGIKQSYARSANVTIPTVASGTYYILARTDIYNRVAERDEANNVRAVPLAVTQLSPDLRAVSLTAPANAQPGQRITIGWEVANDGTKPAGAHIDRVYLSVDTTLSSDDVQVAYANVTATTAPNTRYTQSVQATLPTNLSGARTLIVRADTANAVAESNETNNVASAPISITTSQPDLVPTSLTAPANASTGQSVTVQWSVANQGGANAAAHYDGVYISTDATWSSNDWLLSQVSLPNVLAVGQSYNQSAAFTMPNLANGTYYIIARSDMNGRVTESNEANNVRAATLTVTQVSPDLRAVSLAAPTNAQPGQRITVSWQVANDGTKAAGLHYDRVYLSADATLSSDDVQVAYAYVTAKTEIGANYTQSMQATLPTNLSGARYLILRTDASDTIAESNEANNIQASPITLTAPPTPTKTPKPATATPTPKPATATPVRTPTPVIVIN